MMRNNGGDGTHSLDRYLGNYRLIRVLERGAFASVYLAEHLYLKRLAAIKVMRTVLNDRDKEKFLEEARLLAHLSHPNIVPVHEFAVTTNVHTIEDSGAFTENVPYLVMDFAPGNSLRALHPADSRLPIDVVVGYIKQIAAALQYAHNKGIIHRDVKPENCLLNEQGVVMLSDFGLALLAATPDLLRTQQMAGTVPYTAPEQLRGKPDFASDQYSLGVIAYEWLCGHRPFEGEMVDIIMQHISSPPPGLCRQNPAISPDVEAVVLKALAKKPQQRYPSVQAFAKALEEQTDRWKESNASSHQPEILDTFYSYSSHADVETPHMLSRDKFWTEDHASPLLVKQEKAASRRRVQRQRPPGQKKKGTSLIITLLVCLLLVGSSGLFYLKTSISLMTTLHGTSHGPAVGALAGYWKLDEGKGTTVADASGKNHTGTLQGDASWATGREGSSSIRLNGPTSSVDIADPIVDTTQSYTVVAWVLLNAIGGYQTFMSIDGNQVSGFYLQVRGDTGKFAFTALTSDSTNAGTDFASSTTVPVRGTWYHLAGVYDANAHTLSLYVNSTLQQTVPHLSSWRASGNTMIGRGLYNGHRVDFVDGQVDDARLYTKVLSAQQLQDIPTVGYWPLHENRGTTANDLSPNAITGTITHASWTSSQTNSALSFNGTSSSVSMGTQSALAFGTEGSFSVASWFKTSASGGFHRIVSQGHYGWTNGYFLSIGPDPKVNVGSVGGGVGAGGNMAKSLLFSTSKSFNDGNWHQAIMVINRSTSIAQIYVDGQAQKVTTRSGTCGTASGTTVNIAKCLSLNASGSDSFTIGSFNARTEFFNGSIDDVRVYPYAMNAGAVGGLFRNNPVVPATFTIQANQTGASINPAFYGLMFEDISHSGDGGLSAELIRNRIFKDDPHTPVNWSVVTSHGAQGSMALDNTHQINSTALTTSLQLHITQIGSDQRVGVANTGYWGIPVRPQTTYRASFYAQASSDFSGPLTVAIESNDGNTIYAQGTVNSISPSWQKYSLTLKTGNVTASEANRFVISAGHTGTVWFNLVSLFPPTWNNRTNGLRPDLMQLFNDMKPGFLRFPGGNFLEGQTTSDSFAWKQTRGDISLRPGHNDPWGYRSSDGLGLLEYLEWCEDLHMSPLLAVYAGYSLNGTHIAVGTSAFHALVQDALDEIQYATGSTSTTWGAKRAADGHPNPFSIQSIEIGNEDRFDKSGSYDARFTTFYDAIKAAYPQINLIATTTVKSRTPDLYDDHYYLLPATMENASTHYDTYSRSAPKIFVGEYASQEGKPTSDLNAALGDASFMTGLERNADVVSQASYAPLLVNVNAPNWKTNLIGCDALNSYGSPSYYVQKMFSLYHGDVVLPTQLDGGNNSLYYVTSKASSDGTIYVKVVNAGSSSQKAQLTINGARSIAAQGTAIVLSSGNVTDTNTLSTPNKVVPMTQTLSGLSSSFSYTFAPYSVTVLQLHIA